MVYGGKRWNSKFPVELIGPDEQTNFDICFCFKDVERSDATLTLEKAQNIVNDICKQARSVDDAEFETEDDDNPFNFLAEFKVLQQPFTSNPIDDLESEMAEETVPYEEIYRHHLLISIQDNFVQFLCRAECDVKYSRRGQLTFYCARLKEESARILAARSYYHLRLDASTGDRYNFKTYIPPHLPYDSEAESIPAQQQSAQMRRGSIRSNAKTPPAEDIQIWQRYDEAGKPLQTGYKDKSEYSIFRPVDRIRLLIDHVNRYFDLDQMKNHKLLISYYALHNERDVENLRSTWCNFSRLRDLHNQPIEEIREYFGEAIAFYFLWLGHMTKHMFIPGVLGLFVFAIQIYYERDDLFTHIVPNITSAAYAAYIMLWAAIYMNQWKRVERWYILVWGVRAISQATLEKRSKYKPLSFYRQQYRGAVSILISVIYVGFTIFVVCGIFSLPLFVSRYPVIFSHIEDDVPGLVSMLNVIVISIFDIIWCELATYLTELENWSVESDYTQSLVLKLFVFRFINYFNAFFYLAWVKDYIDPCLPDKSCTRLLRWNLGFTFLTSFAHNIYEIGFPAVCYYYKRHRSLRVLKIRKSLDIELAQSAFKDANKAKIEMETLQPLIPKPESDPALIQLYEGIGKSHETQLLFRDYKATQGLEEDYMEIVLQFGFVVLFSLVLPIIPFLAYASSVFEIRSDAFKILRLHQRPLPRSSSGIGPWTQMLMSITYIAIAVNAGISIFTINLFPDHPLSLSRKFCIFIIAEHAGILAPLFMNCMWPKESAETKHHRIRMNQVMYDVIWGQGSREKTIANVYPELPSTVLKCDPTMIRSRKSSF